jgi:C-1 hydroxylase
VSEVENKAVVRKLIDAWNHGDIDALMTFWSPTMVHHGRSGTVSADDTAAAMRGFLDAFPDLRIELHSVIAEGDLVATRMTMHATHSGSYMGLPPTGRTVSCNLMGQLLMADGAVIDHWGVADALAILVQIGLLPSGMAKAFS